MRTGEQPTARRPNATGPRPARGPAGMVGTDVAAADVVPRPRRLCKAAPLMIVHKATVRSFGRSLLCGLGISPDGREGVLGKQWEARTMQARSSGGCRGRRVTHRCGWPFNNAIGATRRTPKRACSVTPGRRALPCYTSRSTLSPGPRHAAVARHSRTLMCNTPVQRDAGSLRLVRRLSDSHLALFRRGMNPALPVHEQSELVPPVLFGIATAFTGDGNAARPPPRHTETRRRSRPRPGLGGSVPITSCRGRPWGR